MIGIDVLACPSPLHWGESMVAHYGGISVAGEVVVDVGASHGDAACYFLSRGAQRVIAVEGDPLLAAALAEWSAGDDRIVPIQGYVRTPQQLVWLIRMGATVIKMDCEGCEQVLVRLPASILRLIKRWVVEIHERKGGMTPATATTIFRRLSDAGFRVWTEKHSWAPWPFGRNWMLYAVYE